LPHFSASSRHASSGSVSKGVRVVLVVAAVLAGSPARAGALLFPEGEGQAILTTTFSNASNAYDSRGRLIKTPSYRKFELDGYVEYGATDWLTLVGQGGGMDFQGSSSAPAPFSASPAPSYAGLGLGSIGARIRLGEFAGYYFSLEGSLRAASHSAETYLDMRDFLQVDARVQMFHSLETWGFPAFLDAQLGYRSRGQNGDEIRADLTFGVRPQPAVLLMAQSFTAIAPRPSTMSSFAAQKFEVSGVYDLNRTFSVQLGFVYAPFGVNAPAERGIVSAVWARF
jgi:hypothetical protein